MRLFALPIVILGVVLGLIFGTAFFAAAKTADDTVYLSGIDDVPLMQGLTEDQDAGVVFDKPSGRIVEGAASGKVAPGAVTAFYRATLPELGWTLEDAAADSLHFGRDDENLTVSVTAKGETAIVLFSLTPSAAAPQSSDPEQ